MNAAEQYLADNPIEMVDDVQSLWWKGKPIVMTLTVDNLGHGRFIQYGYSYKYGKKQIRFGITMLSSGGNKPKQSLLDVLVNEAFITSYNNYHRAYYIRKKRKLMKLHHNQPYLTPLARMLGGINELRQFRTYLREQRKEGNI